MASISIKLNLDEVADRLVSKISKLQDKEYLLRPVCTDLIDLMTNRIHVEGKKSDGDQMGTYSSRYLAYRQKKFNRTKDTKVVISLSRQLENDWSVVATQKGYGIGFKNSFNMQKARWVEDIYGPIFSLTTGELTFARERINELTNQALQ